LRARTATASGAILVRHRHRGQIEVENQETPPAIPGTPGRFGSYLIGGRRRESARRKPRKILEFAPDYSLCNAVLSHRKTRRGQTPDGLAIRILNRHSPGDKRCKMREGERRHWLSRKKGDAWERQEAPDRPHGFIIPPLASEG
jgi:hypothetical protein